MSSNPSQRCFVCGSGSPSPKRVPKHLPAARSERQVRVILLDVQYHCDPPGPDGDVLGEPQWAWLEKELREAQAPVNIIFSGMQILAEEQPFDKWANYPKSRQRLLRLIKDSRAPGVIFGSGDRHLGELSRMETPETAYPLYDLTSSGLTHHVDSIWHIRNFFSPEKNRYRLGQLFTQKNFGIVDIDWTASPPWMSLQVRDEEGRIRIEERVELSKLRPGLSGH